jgi:hypothetical protein
MTEVLRINKVSGEVDGVEKEVLFALLVLVDADSSKRKLLSELFHLGLTHV